jgi:putative heme transporter
VARCVRHPVHGLSGRGSPPPFPMSRDEPRARSGTLIRVGRVDRPGFDVNFGRACSWLGWKGASRRIDGEIPNGPGHRDKPPSKRIVDETSEAPTAEADLSLGAPAARRRTGALALAPVVLIGVVGLVWLERRSVRHSYTVLAHTQLSSIPFAACAEILSMATLARLQRRLLRAGGAQLSITSMVIIVYASNAISVSIPIAGTPMSAAFSFRSFARRGQIEVWRDGVLTMSGVISTVTFALIVAVGAIMSGSSIAGVAGVLGGLATVVPVLGFLIALRNDRIRARLQSVVARAFRLAQRAMRRSQGDSREVIEATVEPIAGLRLKVRGWVFVFFMATVNWVADIACLALAIGVSLSLAQPLQGSRLTQGCSRWAIGVSSSTRWMGPRSTPRPTKVNPPRQRRGEMQTVTNASEPLERIDRTLWAVVMEA